MKTVEAMKKRGRSDVRTALLVSIFLVSGIMGPQASCQTSTDTAANLALVGATIYVSPFEPAIRDGAILIQGTNITAVGERKRVRVPTNAKVIDCSGWTVLAGFWNSHVHFFERKWSNVSAIPSNELGSQLRETFARHGFTSVFDLSSMWENTRLLRQRIESGEVIGPSIRSTGEGIIPAGGAPPDLVGNMMGMMKTPLPEISTSDEATATARRLISEGVDGVKLFASGQGGFVLSQQAMQAAVAEAHRSAKPVFVHPNSGSDIRSAVLAGVDIIAHTPPYSGAWDETLLRTMRERKVALIPTLMLWKFYARHDRLSVQQKIVETALGQLRAWLDSGVPFYSGPISVRSDPSQLTKLN